jgi:hypothetical protein
MGNEDTTDDALDDRRQFLQGLREHEDVRRLTFTRDGFETVLLELEPGAGFRGEWHRTATRLGYTVERLGADDSLPNWPEDAWVLRLSEPKDRSVRGLATRTVTRVRGFFRWLLGRQ